MWKDKKLVGFLHNHLVKQNSNEEVLRWDSVTRRRKQIPSHAITKDYALHMNGVDHKDRDTADWTVSVKTNRFYMRIFFWLIDGVLHAMYTILKAVVGDNTAHKWCKYLRKNDGRYYFQMDLGTALISEGIFRDWKDPRDPTSQKPPYMRQGEFVPCGCKTCFFCVNGFTTGIAHKRKQATELQGGYDTVYCTGTREKISESATSQRCRVCMKRERELDPSASNKRIKSRAGSTRLGCRTCCTYVCSGCWEVYEHGKSYDI
jgi:hypothetical protein